MIAATLLHAPALALIHAAAFPPGAQWSADTIALQLATPGAYGFIDPGGAMVLARTAADEAEILTIAVLPEARRRSFGQNLLQAAMAEAARRGAHAMLLEVSHSNVPARALYQALQFHQVGRRPAYYRGPDGPEDALILRAVLCPPPSG